ncbi:hypothetical protein IMSAGC006_00041 [Muribaculaceae bacterium]|nr:hypothetical protein IMSAGC006_00041 [Muribaculaceae bacterium]
MNKYLDTDVLDKTIKQIESLNKDIIVMLN